MRDNLIIAILCFVLPFGIFGQPQELLEVDILMQMTEKVESLSSKLKGISSPLENEKTALKGVYLNAEWSPAIVYSKSKEFLNTVARYNIHKNRMELKIDNQLRTLQIANINGIILDNTLFVPLTSGEKSDGNNLFYYKVLSDGELTLLAKHKLTLHTKGGAPMLKNIGTEKEYKSSQNLYYCEQGKKPYILKKGKKNILGLFGSHQSSMEQIADKNDLSYRKESHLISLFNRYNMLIN